MLTDRLIDIIYAVVWGITSPFRLLNDVTLPENFSLAIQKANQHLSGFDFLIPIDTILTIFLIFLGIEVAYFGYKVIMWIIRRFPTQS